MILTNTLFFLSFVAAIGSYWFLKRWSVSGPKHTMSRFAVSVMSGLSFWVTTTYVAWLLGADLTIGTVERGEMGENWWLPIATIVFTVLGYWGLRPNRENPNIEIRQGRPYNDSESSTKDRQ